MSSTRLRPAHLERFTITPVVPGDAPAVFDLISACDMAVLGFVDSSLDDVEGDIAAPPSGGERLQRLVREATSGRLVAWWWTDPRPDSARLSVDMYVHPDLSDPDADAIGAAGWEEITAWAREQYAGWHGEPPMLSAGSIRGDDGTERRLVAAGFARVRTFWRMSGDVPAKPSTPDVPGLLIRPVRDDDDSDTRLVHELMEASFAEHWDHEPESYSSFISRWRAAAGFDPSLWFVAELDGDPVALMLASRRMENENALHIHILGTLPRARGRGVASAMLQHAYGVARREGYGKVQLGVDSDNPTGAPEVYRRAGMDTVFAMHAWHRPVD